jgi:leucyl aminopeptidase
MAKKQPPSAYAVTPSVPLLAQVQVGAASAPGDATVLGVLVGEGADAPGAVGADVGALAAAGFTGKLGQALPVVAGAGPVVAVGAGDEASLDARAVRDAAAAFARAASGHASLALDPRAWPRP